jgi:hypothetical protein
MQNNPKKSTGGLDDIKIKSPTTAVKPLNIQTPTGRSRKVSNVKVC